MLNVVMLNVIMLIVVMLNVVMLSVVMLSVVPLEITGNSTQFLRHSIDWRTTLSTTTLRIMTLMLMLVKCPHWYPKNLL